MDTEVSGFWGLEFFLFFLNILLFVGEKMAKLQKSEAWAYLLCDFALFP